jgi:hypothetical protein
LFVVGRSGLRGDFSISAALSTSLILVSLGIVLNSTGAYFGLGRYFNNYALEIFVVGLTLVLIHIWGEPKPLWLPVTLFFMSMLLQGGLPLVLGFAAVSSGIFVRGIGVPERFLRTQLVAAVFAGGVAQFILLKVVRGETELTDLRTFWAADALVSSQSGPHWNRSQL